MRTVVLATALLWLAPAHAEVAPAAGAEIDFLLSAVARSDCRFARNGVWYDAKTAAAHLRAKYASLAAGVAIGSTEEFIDRAATRSSISGREYAIKCGGGPQIPSRRWLMDLLAAQRAARAAAVPQSP